MNWKSFHFFIIVIFKILFISVFGQQNFLIEKNNNKNSIYIFNSVVENNSFIYTGVTSIDTSHYPKNSFLLKFNQQGNQIDSIYIDGINSSILKLFYVDNHIFVCGWASNGKIYFMKLDTSFNIILSKYFTNTYMINITVNNKSFYVFQITQNNSLHLFKIDFNLNTIDSTTYFSLRGAQIDYLNSLYHNDGYLFAGIYGFCNNNPNYSGELVVFDTTLNLIKSYSIDSIYNASNNYCSQWINTNPLYNFNLPIVNSNNIINITLSQIIDSINSCLSNNPKNKIILTKFNLNNPNNIFYSKIIKWSDQKNYSLTYYYNAIGYSNNNMWLTGISSVSNNIFPFFPQQPQQMFISVMDTNCFLKNIRYYGNATNEWYNPSSIYLGSKNIIAGLYYNFNDSNSFKSFISYLDTSGNIITNLPTNNFNIDIIKIYPNPTKDVLMFNAPYPIDKIEVYNLINEKVMEIYPDNLNTNVIITLNSLNDGPYIIKTQSNFIVNFKKVFLIR